MSHYVKLSRRAQSTPFVSGYGEGFRLVVNVEDTENVPAEIFLFRKRLVNPDTGVEAEELCAVCSAMDLTFYPANEPDLTQNPPYYRKSNFDVVLPSSQTAEEVWVIVQKEVEILMQALDRMDTLGAAEVLEFGDKPVEPSSVSVDIDGDGIPDSVSLGG